MIFLIGQAGTGKTHIAAAMGIAQVLAEKASKIILVRPVVEAADESIGFLPGDAGSKLSPYMVPVRDEIKKICEESGIPPSTIQTEVVPFCHMRGRNFDNCVVIADEAQNMNRKQFLMMLSRMCANCMVLITGDPAQVDVSDSYLEAAVERTRGIRGVVSFQFTARDNVRHPILPDLLAAL